MQYDRIADRYDQGISKDLHESKLEFEMVKLTGISDPRDWKILDIGCGSGIQAGFLISRFPSIASIEGVDSSEKLIDIAKSHNKDERCHYRVGDMHALPFSDKVFDFVYTRYTLHYSSDMSSAMNEIRRVSKPGSSIFIQVVHPIYELFKKTSKDYESGEEATFTPQTAEVKVRHVTHTVSEYINAALLSGMGILNIEERFGGQSDIDDYRVPTVLILRLTNKEDQYGRKQLPRKSARSGT